MRKNAFALLPIMLMTLGFTACGDDDDEVIKPETEQPEDKPEDKPEENPENNPEDNPGEEPTSQSAVSSIILTDNGEKLLLTGVDGLLDEGEETSVWSMAYDNQGRLSQAFITEDDEVEGYQLSYEPFKIELSEEYRYVDDYGKEHIVTMSGTLNAKGYLASIKTNDYLADKMDEPYYDTSVNLEYDEDDHLIKADVRNDEQHNWDGASGGGTWTFTWKDGLMTEANYYDEFQLITIKEHYKFNYSRTPNKYKQYTVGLTDITNTDPFALAGLIGKAPDQYLDWYGYSYEEYEDGELSEDDGESFGLNYEVNEDGTLAKEVKFVMATGGPLPIEEEYTYIYSPFGSTTRMTPAAPAWTKKNKKPRLPFQPRCMAR